MFVGRRAWDVESDTVNIAKELAWIQEQLKTNSTIFLQISGGPNYSVDLRNLTNVDIGTRLSFCRFNSTGTNIKIHSIEINSKQIASLHLLAFGSLIEVVYNAGGVWNVVGGQGYNVL